MHIVRNGKQVSFINLTPAGSFLDPSQFPISMAQGRIDQLRNWAAQTINSTQNPWIYDRIFEMMKAVGK